MNTIQHCQVELDLNQAESNAAEFARSIRRLNKSRKTCITCISLEECEVHYRMISTIQTAISEVQEEWSNLF